MTDRDRLIELIGAVQSIGVKYTHEETASSMGFRGNAELADYLLANGVIVPQCNFKDTIYRIGSKGQIYGDWELMYIQVYPDEILYIDDSDNYFTSENIGKTVFLTKEEAEEKLKELKDND